MCLLSISPSTRHKPPPSVSEYARRLSGEGNTQAHRDSVGLPHPSPLGTICNSNSTDKTTHISDDFEVSIFLTETSTRHSLLYKHKHFHDTSQTKLTSTSTKLTGASREAPVDVDDELAVDAAPILREESDDDVMALDHIPTLDQDETAGAGMPTRASKRRRGRTMVEQRGDGGAHDAEQDSTDVPVVSDEDDDLFVSSDEDNEATGQRPAKRRKDTASVAEDEMARDDKKKLAMDISYEGFAIYGRVLCLVVKRRGDGAGNKGKGVAVAGGGRASRAGAPAGQAMMENWISSTQMPEAAGNELSEGA